MVEDVSGEGGGGGLAVSAGDTEGAGGTGDHPK